MTAWLSEKDKEDLITSVESQFGSGVKNLMPCSRQRWSLRPSKQR